MTAQTTPTAQPAAPSPTVSDRLRQDGQKQDLGGQADRRRPVAHAHGAARGVRSARTDHRLAPARIGHAPGAIARALAHAFAAHADEIAAGIGRRALDELLVAHRRWIEWLDTGRVCKLALVTALTPSADITPLDDLDQRVRGSGLEIVLHPRRLADRALRHVAARPDHRVASTSRRLTRPVDFAAT